MSLTSSTPNLTALDELVATLDDFKVEVGVDFGEFKERSSFIFELVSNSRVSMIAGMLGPGGLYETTSDALLECADRVRSKSDGFKCVLRINPYSTSIKKVEFSTTKKPFRLLWIKALHEVMGLPAPDTGEIEGYDKKKSSAKRKAKAAVLAELRGGSEGIAKFNARERLDVTSNGPFRRLSFEDFDLSGVNLQGLDFRGCSFEGCNLQGAILVSANLRKAVFANCDLSGARLDGARLEDADLQSSLVEGTSLEDIWWSATTKLPPGCNPGRRNWQG